MKETLVDLFNRVENKGPDVSTSAQAMVDKVLAKKGVQKAAADQAAKDALWEGLK